MTKMGKKDNTAKTIYNALTLLEYLSFKPEGERITKISQDLELNITSIHRMLKTMMKKGFVEQEKATRVYRIGVHAQFLRGSQFKKTDLYTYGLTFLKELSKRTLETANLIIENEWEAVYVLQVESPNSLRVANSVGSRAPLYCTAAGKVLLAYMDSDRKKRYFKELSLAPCTCNTLDSKERLKKEIAEVQKTRIAYDREEQALGEVCIATPVFNQMGKVVAAISISFPASRPTKGKKEEFVLPLKEIGCKLSEKLGFRE